MSEMMGFASDFDEKVHEMVSLGGGVAGESTCK